MLPQGASTFSMMDHQEAFPFVPLLLLGALMIRCSCESQGCPVLHREPGGGIECFPLTGEYPSVSMWKSFTRKSHNVSVTRWYNSSASRSCVTHSMPPGIHDPEKKKTQKRYFCIEDATTDLTFTNLPNPLLKVSNA